MNSRKQLKHCARIAQHFASTRWLEILALQASPLLGIFLGGFSIERCGWLRPGLLIFGSLALTGHVFVFNDWAGHESDIRDPGRTRLVFTGKGISSRQVACFAIALLVIANIAFAVVGKSALLFGDTIAALGILYSWSRFFGKGTPIIASLNHLIGGSLHFLLGYSVCHSLDARGLLISLFFGLVFAGGHLNQEVRDYDGDSLNGIRTSAVVFGCRPAFLASLCLFTTAYALLVVLSSLGYMPRILLWISLVWPLHVAWSMQALKRGLGYETALWMQRRYRMLFAFIGVAMLAK